MTCKDCIHRPVCVLRTNWGVGSDWNNRYTPDVEKRCKDFINKAEIENLQLENRVLSQKRINFFERLQLVNDARDRAFKEFAEALKAKISKPEHPWEDPPLRESDIDEVLKEMRCSE